MRKTVLNGLLISGVSLFLLGGGVLSAQAPGAGAGAGAGQAPVQRPSSPDMHNPSSTDNPDAMSGKKIDDKKFVKDAAIGGMTEVELGKVAVQKASSDQVKQFGQKMIDDHTKANDQLKEIASKENLAIPTSLDSKHQALVDKMSKLSGPAFDKAYVKDMLKDHKEDVSEFQAEAQNGSDPNLKQFASTTLPVLQEHLSMVKDLSKNDKQVAMK